VSNGPFAMWDEKVVHFCDGTLTRDERVNGWVISIQVAPDTLCGLPTDPMLGPDTHRNRVVPPNANYCHMCVNAAITKETHA
jgi:hypothetical protein